MDIRIDVQEDHVVATAPAFPGCRARGADPETAVARLDRLLHVAHRAQRSPFASVRKRLAERPGPATTR